MGVSPPRPSLAAGRSSGAGGRFPIWHGVGGFWIKPISLTARADSRGQSAITTGELGGRLGASPAGHLPVHRGARWREASSEQHPEPYADMPIPQRRAQPPHTPAAIPASPPARYRQRRAPCAVRRVVAHCGSRALLPPLSDLRYRAPSRPPARPPPHQQKQHAAFHPADLSADPSA